MKKIIVITIIAAFALISEMNAGIKHKFIGNDLWVTTTDGGCRYTEYPEPGKDHWTYRIVATSKDGNQSGMLYHTKCNEPGPENCRAKLAIFDNKYTEDGRLVYDQEYAFNSVEMMLNFVESKYDEGFNEGEQSFNEATEDYLIYRNVSWSRNAETGELSKTVSISSFEIIKD